MSLKKKIIAKDPRLSIISSEVIRNIPCVESVILCGSRATTQQAKPLSTQSDYDVALVMKTPLVPFYLRKIKMVEEKLSKKFEVRVNLNPLPTCRIRNAKGNLFLFKVKTEGTIIWGKDYIGILNPGCIKDIGTDWYFSYLCSLMKEFAQNFNPSLMHKFDAEHRNLIYCAAKALLGCGQLLLLLREIYETDAKAVVDKLSEYGRVEVVGSSFSVDARFLESLNTALNIKEGLLPRVDDPLDFCLSAKDCLLEMFRLLMKYFYELHTPSLDKLVIEYLKVAKGKSVLKNVEYSALIFLIKREVSLKALISMPLVVDRMRAALIWLLVAINEDKTICRDMSEKAYYALKDHVALHYSNEDISLWLNVKHAVCTYWPYACTVMGL